MTLGGSPGLARAGYPAPLGPGPVWEDAMTSEQESTEVARGEIVDTYINLPSRERREGMDPNIERWFVGKSPDLLGGVTPAQVVGRMDEGGVQIGLLNVSLGGDYVNPHVGGFGDTIDLDAFRASCQQVADACREFPDRFRGSCNIDPTQGMNAVRMVEIAVEEFDFRTVRVMGALVNLPPNHALMYPIYTKCIELGVPIVINVGVPGPLRFAKYQRPMDLDEVLVTYPELTVVATHIGHPWHVETVALLQKHANFYLMTSGFAPRYIPDEVIHYMNTRGRERVMWASDYAILPFDRAVAEGLALPLREGVKRRYMRENALAVFNFD
jgi:predicted TIM-barrel fold metal-dependent hydrolase